MESTPISNSDDVIHSTALLTRINWLRQALNYRFSEGSSKELAALHAFRRNIDAVASASTYDSGADLVRDSYLEEYKNTLESPDREKPAFSPVDFGGVTYWLRH